MDKDSLSDERLASLHQKKRVNAFFILYRRYKNYGYAVVYNTLEQYNLVNALKDEKDSILYDSIIEAIASFDKNKGTFRNLLAAIITNQTINCIREFSKDPLSDYISLDAGYRDGSNLRFADSVIVAAKDDAPGETINCDDRSKKVVINYHGVYKRNIRKMIRLREMGYSYAEIARKFKSTEKAIRAIFYRLKRKVNAKENNRIKK